MRLQTFCERFCLQNEEQGRQCEEDANMRSGPLISQHKYNSILEGRHVDFQEVSSQQISQLLPKHK